MVTVIMMMVMKQTIVSQHLMQCPAAVWPDKESQGETGQLKVRRPAAAWCELCNCYTHTGLQGKVQRNISWIICWNDISDDL